MTSVLLIEMEDCEPEQEPRTLPRRAYLVGGLVQLAVGMHSPFLNSYLVDMGASYAELGTAQSVRNVAPTVLQPLWGAASDKVGHRKAFVAFGTSTGLFIVYLFLWAATPIDVIVLFAVQSVLFSIQIPTWLSLIGGLMDENNRGDELGKLGVVTNLTSLCATLLSGFIAGFPSFVPALREMLGDLGYILFPAVEAWRESYYLPFYLTAIVGIIASIISVGIKEKPVENREDRKFPPVHKLLSQPGDFRRFCFVAVFFSFAMSMSWPYFVVVQRVWLENTLLEIAIASAIMTSTIVLFTSYFGRLSDRVGRKPMIIFGRGILFLIPLMYAFATHVFIIYIANAIAGVSVAASSNANTAYVYDVAPAEERGSYLAVYNTFTGVVFLFGSLIAGLIGEVLVPIFGSYGAVFIMLLTSATLRFVASFFYLLLNEPREYQSTVSGEIRSFIFKRRTEGL